MNRYLLVSLDSEDFQRLEMITNNIVEVSDVLGAIKWALKRSTLGMGDNVTQGIEWKFVLPEPKPVEVDLSAPPKVPLSRHNCLSIQMKDLAQCRQQILLLAPTIFVELFPQAEVDLTGD